LAHHPNHHLTDHPNPATALARVVVDEMAAAGVALVVISPGSRSAALAIAAAEHPDLDTRVFIDERSAAFHALGAARASGRPVAVLSTSGTAPAHFFPAIIEADMACVPLIAMSADRPAELRGVGANQTIDQEDLFGDKVRGQALIEAPEPDVDSNVEWRSVVAGLVARSMQPKPGPVHLNVAFREPTVPVSDDGRTRSDSYRFPTPRLESEPTRPEVPLPTESALEVSGHKGLVIAGDGRYDRFALTAEASRLGWPVLATALSGLRGESVVSSYRRILTDGIPEHLIPEVVVAVGSIGPDPSLEGLFAAAQQRVRVDWWGRHIDPGRNATERHAADPVRLLAGLEHETDPSWAAAWRHADQECETWLIEIVDAAKRITGAGVARVLNHLDWGALVVASSLPIREVDAHLRRAGPVFANRGASGIDGFVSTSLGVAATIPRTLALSGDLSLLHDANGFLHDGVVDLTLIVIDNGGGGLFDSLPQAVHAPQYERLFVADPERDLGALARFHGARVEQIDDLSTLLRAAGEALPRPGVDVLVTPVHRKQDLEMRAQLFG
jgi:2-succinyl-5-enolpyruvyl-6-hydroxy-3-cyclohexene-1-carboxylate synthase